MNQKIQEWMMSIVVVTFLPILVLGCGKIKGINSTSFNNEDSSASGVVASVVGGALSGSDSNGTLSFLFQNKLNAIYAAILEFVLPDTQASNTCPTFKSTDTTCTASGGTLWLTYNDCQFNTSGPTWKGTQALIMSSGTANCGFFPNPGAGGTLVRQFVSASSSTTPDSITVTTPSGVIKTLDHVTVNLGNFNGDTIATKNFANGGYGIVVSFNTSGAKSGLNIAQHVTAVKGGQILYNVSISGGLTVTETAGSSSRTVSGSVNVYHNLLKVIGKSTFNNVGHTNTCCMPTSGSVTTTFATGSKVSPSTEGSTLVGKSETLTFTGCGTGTLVDTSGSSINVTFNHCG